MKNLYQGWSAQQVLDHWPHPVPSPDTPEARQARVAQRFRLYFLGPVDVGLQALGRRNLGAKKQATARALLTNAEQAKALMHAPPNAFLVAGHGRHLEAILSDLHGIVATLA